LAFCATSLSTVHCSGGAGSSGNGPPDDAGAGDALAAPDAPVDSQDGGGCAPNCPASQPVWSGPTALPFTPIAIHGSSPTDVWVLGSQSLPSDSGTSTIAVLTARFDGTTWKPVPTPSTMHDPTAIFAGGAAGTFVSTNYIATVFKWDGTSWSQSYQASLSNSYALGGASGSDMWLGTQWNFCDGPLYHYDGNAWTGIPFQNGMESVSAFLPVPGGSVIAAFESGLYAGDATSGQFQLVVSQAGIRKLAGTWPDDVWMFGTLFNASSVTFLAGHSDGTKVTAEMGPNGENLINASCAGKGDCWIIGLPANSNSSSGALFHTENGTLVSQQGKPGAPAKVNDVWVADANHVFALDGANVYRFAPPAHP
jgi:hypothetical protein